MVGKRVVSPFFVSFRVFRGRPSAVGFLILPVGFPILRALCIIPLQVWLGVPALFSVLLQVQLGLLALSVTLSQVRRGLRPLSRKLRQVPSSLRPLRSGLLALSPTLRALRRGLRAEQSKLRAFRTIPQPERAIGAGLSQAPYAPQGQPARALPGLRGLGKPRSCAVKRHIASGVKDSSQSGSVISAENLK